MNLYHFRYRVMPNIGKDIIMSYLPGQELKVLKSDICEEGDCYDKAVLKIVGEVDSFGYETFCMCEKHADAYKKSLEDSSDEEQSCDWCRKMSTTVDFYRDWEEGSNGPVYEVCESCRRKNAATHDDFDDEFYDDDDDDYNEEVQCEEEGCSEFASFTLAPRNTATTQDSEPDDGNYCQSCGTIRNNRSRLSYVKDCYADNKMADGFTYIIERPDINEDILRFEGGSVSDIHKMIMSELNEGGSVSFSKNYFGLFQWRVVRRMEYVLRISIIDKGFVIDDCARNILMHS